MASEKITALIEEVKNLSVLELSELVKALAQSQKQQKKRLNLMSFWKASMPQQRSRSSRSSAKLLVWVWLMPRQLSKAFPPL